MRSALTTVAVVAAGLFFAPRVHADDVVTLLPLESVRLTSGPFLNAANANREYLLEHDADRFLAPLLREAGLEPKKPPYPNWESQGLDGHSAGHYLSALSLMIASGHDADGELGRRLDYMLEELQRVQRANRNGYLGGVPGSRELWQRVADGDVRAIRSKWVPWYNVHKTFVGLRDAYQQAGRQSAKELLVGLGDWCLGVVSGLSDEQMQQMLATEYGGMNEALADIYTISGDKKYLEAAQRFNHRQVFEPLMRGEDRLTGLHANTQVPKIVGMQEVAALTRDANLHQGADFFWRTVTQNRSSAFGGNSVSEHFNDPKDFSGMIEHREGPESCNTYNMLRLTEKLFTAEPNAEYADYYERALYNHILSIIDPENPGYVYFTPLRPNHYRVYSVPEQAFWCCVGTGMENPGRYGQFVYAENDQGDLYVNLFVPSVAEASDGVTVEQVTRFPYEPRTKLTLKLDEPKAFALRIRHPAWVRADDLAVSVNGERVETPSKASSYATLERTWQDGDTVEVELPMRVAAEKLPDGSDWAAILYGPIVLASTTDQGDTPGVRANAGRMAHVAAGAVFPLDKADTLLTSVDDLPQHVTPDPTKGPLHFKITGIVVPEADSGIELQPFFSVREERYQMYFELTNEEKLERRREQLAAEERAKAARDAATVDVVKPGEQQSEVEHDYQGEQAETGIHNGMRWRHGQSFEYALDTSGEKNLVLSVTYSGDDSRRTFDIFADGEQIATERLRAEKRGEFIERHYPIPAAVIAAADDGRITIKFAATNGLAGGVFDVRLMKPATTTTE